VKLSAELQQHYIRLNKDDRERQKVFRGFRVHRPPAEVQPREQPQEPQPPSYVGGLKEVSDELFSEELDVDVVPTVQPKRKSPKSTPKPTPKVRGRKCVTTNLTPEVSRKFPLPPSPISSPSDG
jgi:hypothetical protein